MSAPTVAETFDRAEVLKRLFPDEARDLVKFEDKPRPYAWVTPSQRELFRAMVARDMKPRQILDLYIALFPEDGWAKGSSIRSATDLPPQSN
jgi:hypothetical protein